MPMDPAQLAINAGNAALAVPPQQAADLQNNAALQNIVQGGAQQPNPSLAPQSPGKPTSKLKAVLSNFFTGFALANGMPQAQAEVQQKRQETAESQARVPLIQQQTEQAKIQNALQQRRLQMIQQMQTGNLGQDVISPLGELAPHEQATINAARAEAAMKADMSPVFDAVKQIGNQRAIWGRSAAQGKFTMATVTPDMVAAGVPRQLLGQEMPLDQIQRLTGRSVFSNRTVMGANGPAIVNTNPMSPDFGKTVNLGLGNPGVATALARPMAIVDPNDPSNVIPVSAGQAIKTGSSLPQSGYSAASRAVDKYFTSGKGGQTLNAFNTAQAHLGTLSELAVALGNGDIQQWNRLAQGYSRQTGNPAPTNFDTAKAAVAGEIASTFKSSGATDEEIKQILNPLNTAESPAQLAGAINTFKDLLESKRAALQGQYQSGKSGKPAFPGNGNAAGMVTMRAPNGQTKTVPQSEVPHYLSLGARVVK